MMALSGPLWKAGLNKPFAQRLFYPALPCSACRSKSTAHETFRQARFMKKLMIGSNRSRRKFFTVEQPVSKVFTEFDSSTRSSPSGPTVKSKKCLRRVEVLNTMFMEQISSMLSTGEVSDKVLGLGLTISRVKVSSDFSRIIVYWVASGSKEDEEKEAVLRECAGMLRHMLSQLRVIGIVPPIEFVKDKQFSKAAEVELLLRRCDFGDGFVPTKGLNLLSQVGTKAEAVGWEELDEEAGEGEPEIASREPAPATESALYASIPMRQDVLGVRHDAIMEQVRGMMQRVKSKKERLSTSSIQETSSDDNHVSDSSTQHQPSMSLKSAHEEVVAAKKRQQEFFKYLKKRQHDRAAQLKQLTTTAKEKEFYEEEKEYRWQAQLDSLDAGFDERDFEDDYYDRQERFYSDSKLDYR